MFCRVGSNINCGCQPSRRERASTFVKILNIKINIQVMMVVCVAFQKKKRKKKKDSHFIHLDEIRWIHFCSQAVQPAAERADTNAKAFA